MDNGGMACGVVALMLACAQLGIDAVERWRERQRYAIAHEAYLDDRAQANFDDDEREYDKDE